MTDQSEQGNPDWPDSAVAVETLPDQCQWEIGVCERDDPHDWEHYHPTARSEKEAKKQARKQARADGFREPEIFMATGPHEESQPATASGSVITEVFDGLRKLKPN